MSDPHNLQRFIEAQEPVFDAAFAELGAGSKQTHWMWFIFPQLAALGRSPTALYYGIASLDEAKAYRVHPLLGRRLVECVHVLLPWVGRRSAEQIFGTVDAIKLRSSLTLFEAAEAGGVFSTALAGFFNGERDPQTLALLNGYA